MEERMYLVARIIEHQRNIILLKHFINELEDDGVDISKMTSEIEELERKIEDLQTRCPTV
jgi:uncharacterized protein Yka (UPF0111/DUF47 family)